MKKKLKTALLSVVSLVLLIVILLVATFFFWLGPTVKLLAETIGSKALGTPVSMELLSINPRAGTIQLNGFLIGSPDGFGHSNTVSLTELTVSIDMDTVFSDTIVVQEILIDSPHFIYEQSSTTDNITEFITNVFAFAKIDPNETKETEPEPEAVDVPEKDPKKVVINHLRVTDVKMSVENTDDETLDIHVGVEEIGLSMTNGLIQIKNLTLSDPGLIETPNIFALKALDVQLDPASIYSDQLIIENVQITKPHVYFEQNPETDTLSELLRIADSFTSRATLAPAPPVEEEEIPEPETEVDAGSGPLVEVRGLVIDDIQLHVVNIADPQLNVRIRLEQLAVSPSTGTVRLANLTASNPDRLATPNLFELEAIAIQLDPTTLASGTVVIKEVQVVKPYAFLEQNRETDTVAEFMKIAASFAPKPSKKAKPPTQKPGVPESPADTDNEPSPPPIELHNLLVDDIQLKFLDTTSTNAPAGLQTMASVGSISVKLVEGALRIEAITIPNPAGNFTSTNLFHLTNIDVTIDPASVFSEQVIIQEVFVNAPLINLEQTESTGNVAELQKIASGFIPPAPETPAAPASAPAPENGTTNAPVLLAEQPIILDRLIVTNFVVNMITPSSTNAPSMGAQGMAQLDKFMPRNLMTDGSHTNVPPSEDTLSLLAFDRLSMEPLKGLIQIGNLQVGNPKGFANKNLVSVEHLRVDINPDSMMADTLLIEDILIDNPKVAYERQLSTDNIKALQKFIEGAVNKREESMDGENSAQTASTTNAPIAVTEDDANAANETAAEEAGQKVIIEHLLVTGGIVRAKLSALPTAPIPLPNIEMTGIGKEEGGATLASASSKVYESLYDAIIGSVASVTGFAGDALKGVGSLTMGALGSVTGGATDGIQEGLGLDGKSAEPSAEKPKKEKKKYQRRMRRPGSHF